MEPLVTIILPVYNSELFIHEAISCILNQDYQNIEFLIINDGSTDKTENIIFKFKNTKIKYVKNTSNKGLIYTLNKGIKLANGKYIARMDADDLCHPTRIRKQVAILEKDEQIGVCGTNFKYIGKRNESIKYPENHKDIKTHFINFYAFCHASALLRRSILNIHNLNYNNKFTHVEDYELWSHLIQVTKIHNLQEELYYYRYHNTNISQIHFKTKQFAVQECRILNLKNNLGYNLNEEELELFNEIHNLKSNSNHPKSVYKFLWKLYKLGCQNEDLNHDILFDILRKWWTQYILSIRKYKPKFIYVFLTSKFRLNSFNHLARLIVKCIIKWEQKI